MVLQILGCLLKRKKFLLASLKTLTNSQDNSKATSECPVTLSYW